MLQSVRCVILSATFGLGACLATSKGIHPGRYTGFGYCCGGTILEVRDCVPLKGRAQTCPTASERPIECKRYVECRPDDAPCVICSRPGEVSAFAGDDLPREALRENVVGPDRS